jgi:hypothetical protein
MVGCGFFGIGLIDTMLRPPDTMNGVVIAGLNGQAGGRPF